MTSTQTEDGGLGPPVKGINLVFLWVICMVVSTNPAVSDTVFAAVAAVAVDAAVAASCLAEW